MQYPAARLRALKAAPGIHEHKNRSWQANVIAFILLLATSGLMTGCGSIMVSDHNAAANAPASANYSAQRVANSSGVSEAPNTQEMHDLSIAAVDFDPNLNMDAIVSGRPYSLLVAVENKGNRSEGPFTVTTQLLSPDRRQVLLSALRTVPVLSAGDITVVRFPVNSAPPRQRMYLLNTQVQAVPREANTTNNQRLLDIQINVSN